MSQPTDGNTVSRVNITDEVRLRRIEMARQRMRASTPTKAAGILLDHALTEMGIPLIESDDAMKTAAVNPAA